MKKISLGQGVWVTFTLIVVAVLIALGFYNSALEDNLFSFAEKSFAEVTNLQRANFDGKLGSEMDMLENLSVMFGNSGYDRQQVLDSMEYALARSSCDNLFIVRNDGKGIVNDGREIDVSSREYFRKAMNKEPCIGDPIISILDENKLIVTVSQPIIVMGEVRGMLGGTYDVKNLDSLLLTTYECKGNAIVVTADGEIIASTLQRRGDEEQNLKSMMDYIGDTNSSDAGEMMIDMANGKSGSVSYTLNGSKMYMLYTPVQSSNWFMLSFIREDIMTENYGVVSRNAIFLTLGIVAVFTGLLVVVLLVQRKINRERRTHIEEMERVAYYDDMTGLPNINNFKREAQRIIDANPNIPFVFVKMDIVNFKAINEISGFGTGDNLICALGKTLTTCIDFGRNPLCACARVYADEFIVLDVSANVAEAELKRGSFDSSFQNLSKSYIEGQGVRLRYGRYFAEKGENNIEDILEKVNLAHRLTKTEKFKNVCDYDADFKLRLKIEADIERQMHDALEKREYKMHLQAKVDVKTEKIIGAEALVRWIRSDGLVVMPGEFIPLFEKNGFVVKLDIYMLECACKYLETRILGGLIVVPISVNFSRLHLNNPNFVTELDKVVSRYKIPKEYIEIELTESTIFENTEALVCIFRDLHKLGYKLLMDDFGKGYSSLGSLKSLPVDVIKIDKEFFSEGVSNVKARTIIESTVQMAKKLSISVVAEGVETREQVEFLRDVGCDAIQGYYYSKPGTASEFKY